MLSLKNIFLIPLLMLFIFPQSCSQAPGPTDVPEPQEKTENPDTPNDSGTTEDQATTDTVTTSISPLKIENGKIVDSQNNAVQLRGMSLFWSQWMPQFYNFETVKNLKEHWNINVIRAAMAVEHEGYLEHPEREKQKVMEVIDAAIELDIYVIVDWHDHNAENHLEEAKTFFSEIAEKYQNYPNIIYETYNEPLDVSWSNVLKPYHEEVIASIRQYDKDNIIVLGTPNWSQRVDLAAADPVSGENLAYTLHFYAGTHKEDLRQKAEIAIQKGLAIFVTEFGTTNADGDGNVDKEETQKWFDFMNEHDLSWCNWSITSKDEASAAIIPETTPQDLSKEENLSTSGKVVWAELSKRTANN